MKKYTWVIFCSFLLISTVSTKIHASSHNETLAKSLIKTIRHYEDNSLDSAFMYVNQLLQITDSLPTQLKAYSYIIIGEMYDNASIFDIAFQYFEKAMVLLPEHDPKLPYLYSEIGEFYTSFADFERSRYYLDLAYQSALEVGSDNINLAGIYYDYGTYYWENLQYDSSELYLEKAAFLIKKEDPVDYDYLTLVNAELAEVYLYNEDLESAGYLISEIESYPKQYKYSKYATAYILFVKGVYALETDNHQEGINLINRALDEGKEIGLEVERSNLQQFLIDIYLETGDFKNAFDHQQQKSEIDKKIINNQNKARVAALEILHESEKKDQTIQIQEEAIGKREKVIWISIGILILISVLVFLLYRTVQSVNSKNKHIETLMRELHHRVKNNLQVISSLLGLQSMKLDDPNAKKAVEDSKRRVKAMSLIHQRLYQGEGIALIDFDSYVEELINDLKHSYMPDSNVKIDLNIPKVNFDVDTTLPLGLIINELISNSFKYAFNDIQEPVLKVELLSQSKSYTLNISDNGKGLEEELNIETSSSFGLKLVNLLVKQLKGKIACDATNGMNYKIQFSN